MLRPAVFVPLSLALLALLAPEAFAQAVGKPDVDGGAAGARAGRDAGNDDS